jgi:hypothetical protein
MIWWAITSRIRRANPFPQKAVHGLQRPQCHALHIQWRSVFDWDENNLRKIRAHRVKRADVEQALSNGPILIYEQSVGGNRALCTTVKPMRDGCWRSS